jgi:hypothetical protein
MKLSDVKSVLTFAEVVSNGPISENVMVPPGPVLPVGLIVTKPAAAGRPPNAKDMETSMHNRRTIESLPPFLACGDEPHSLSRALARPSGRCTYDLAATLSSQIRPAFWSIVIQSRHENARHAKEYTLKLDPGGARPRVKRRARGACRALPSRLVGNLWIPNCRYSMLATDPQ